MRENLAIKVGGTVTVFLLCALLSRLAGMFDMGLGVALVFPGAAAAVIGGVLLGWWGVAAAFLGYLLTPWHASILSARGFYFAAVGALQAAIPALAHLRAEGPTSKRVLRLVFYAAIANTILPAIAGIGGLLYWVQPPLTHSQTVLSLLTWFLGDATAIVLLAFPVILFLQPGLLLTPEEDLCFRRWLAAWPSFLPILAIVVLDVFAMEFLAPVSGVSIHWLAVLLVVPVLVGAAAGGVGGSVLVNGIVGVVYVFEVFHLGGPATPSAMFRTVFSSYVNLAGFSIAALVAGTFAGRNRVLLHQLDEHRRLLQRNFESVVTALAAAIEAKDRTTEGHVQRVARLVVRVGRRLGVKGQRLEILRYAAILHDIGKIGTPESILNKPGLLTAHERKVMEEHVNTGVDILDSVELLKPAIPFIRYHQERWDGRTENVNYPGYFGLQGEEIPLEARIIAVVDALDAMTNDRPYRRAMGRFAAAEELRREAGRQFDPTVVQVVLDLTEGPAEESTSDRFPVLDEAGRGWLKL